MGDELKFNNHPIVLGGASSSAEDEIDIGILETRNRVIC
jgi:hypothetical protein